MTPKDLSQGIADGCNELGLSPDEKQIESLAFLVTELQRWNLRINLTAITDTAQILSHHIFDSLAISPWLRGNEIIDFGTGAGFPGLPLAILNRQCRFTLLDSNGRKISFVRHIITSLKLTNAQPVQSRIEDYAPAQAFDTVIARALATIPEILELGGHLAAQDAVVLALKGRYPAEELEDTDKLAADWQYQVAEVSVPGLETHSRHIVSLERRAA